MGFRSGGFKVFVGGNSRDVVAADLMGRLRRLQG